MPSLSDITHIITDNQVAAGLSATAVLGALAYQARRIPYFAKTLFTRLAVVSLTVRSDDDAFGWLDRWLAAQPYARRARSVALRSYYDDDDRPRGTETEATWNLAPGEGVHWFWWRRRFVWLHRQDISGENAARRTEAITISLPGRSQTHLRLLVEEAKSLRDDSTTVPVHIWRSDYWQRASSKASRPLSSVILAAGQAERIVEDAERFLASRDIYPQRGVPWRRGYLFEGLPGTGKTSFVLALASRLRRPIFVLPLSSLTNDTQLVSAVMCAPHDAILLMEDVDCARATTDREKDEKDAEKGATRGGLLNVLDGVSTPDGRIFIMTTNYPDRLDAALLRPGRVDLRETFQALSGEEQTRMAARYYAAPFQPLPFALTPAVMQGAFMLHPDDPDAARAALLQAAHPRLAA